MGNLYKQCQITPPDHKHCDVDIWTHPARTAMQLRCHYLCNEQKQPKLPRSEVAQCRPYNLKILHHTGYSSFLDSETPPQTVRCWAIGFMYFAYALNQSSKHRYSSRRQWKAVKTSRLSPRLLWLLLQHKPWLHLLCGVWIRSPCKAGFLLRQFNADWRHKTVDVLTGNWLNLSPATTFTQSFLSLKVICNGSSQNWWKVVSSCLLQYKPVYVINFDKLRCKMLKK